MTEQLVRALILGIPIGCVYGLVATGLVLTYKTSGVFNLAFGAQAFVSAAVFYDTRGTHEWPLLPAFVLSVMVVAPLIGFVLDRVLFRYLRNAPATARLVSSIGLLVAIPEITMLWFGRGAKYSPPSLAPDPFRVYNPFGPDYAVDQSQVVTIVLAVLSVLALTVMFRWSAVGLRMRAVVESPRLTELAGVSADRVSGISWMMSSAFAGLAGVLLMPLYAQVAANNYFSLLVAAIAAAVFAGLTSIPLALIGGVLLGVLEKVLAELLPQESIVAANLRPSLPFIALFLLLIARPGLRGQRELTDPLSGVDAPMASQVGPERLSRWIRVSWPVAAALFLPLVYLWLNGFDAVWRFNMTQAVIYALIFLSITVITGMAGQISLCQTVFAATGAYATARLAENLGMSVLVAMLLGAVLAAAVGVLIAVPALRLGGIYLTLATLAFALMYQYIVVPNDWAQGVTAPTVPRPVLGPIDFGVNLGDNVSFLVLCTFVFLAVAGLVVLVRHGTTGQYLDALRGSEVAAASIGVSATRARITAFALSAGIAGLGGGLLAMQKGQITFDETYNVFFALVWVVVVVAFGVRSIQGALQAGYAFVILRELLQKLSEVEVLGLSLTFLGQPGLLFILFGLGAITYARHPEGAFTYQMHASQRVAQRLVDRIRGRGRSGGPEVPGEKALVAPEQLPAGRGH